MPLSNLSSKLAQHMRVCTHAHTHMHTHTCTHTCAHTHVRVRVHTHTHKQIYKLISRHRVARYELAHMRVCTHAHTHMQTHTCTHTCAHTHVRVRAHTHTQADLQAHIAPPSGAIWALCSYFLLVGLYTSITLIGLQYATASGFHIYTTNRNELYLLNCLSPAPSVFLLDDLYRAITLVWSMLQSWDLVHTYRPPIAVLT